MIGCRTFTNIVIISKSITRRMSLTFLSNMNLMLSMCAIPKIIRHEFWELGSFLSFLITDREEQVQCFDEEIYVCKTWVYKTKDV